MIMEENNVITYYPLGQKTLFMLILRKSGVLLLTFFGLFVGLFLLSYIPPDYFNIAIIVIFIYVAFLFVILLGTFFLGWLEYFRYKVTIGGKDLKIKKGLIATEEVGVPFRRIRDVKIRRSLLDQIVGVSDVAVILSDFEEQDISSGESIVFLPSLEKNIAIQIQDNILKKSQVEQIHMVEMHEDVLNRFNK